MGECERWIDRERTMDALDWIGGGEDARETRANVP